MQGRAEAGGKPAATLLPGGGGPPTVRGMHSDPERRRLGLETMGKVYGWEVADGDGDFFGMTVEHLFAEVWTREGLTFRDRRLLLIGLLVGRGLDDVLGLQLEAALGNGELEPRAAGDRDLPHPLRRLAGGGQDELAGRGAARQGGPEGGERGLTSAG